MFEILKAFIKTQIRIIEKKQESGSFDWGEACNMTQLAEELLAFLEELQRMPCAGCGQPIDTPHVEKSQETSGKYSQEVLERILPGLNEACKDGRIVVFDRSTKSLSNAICASNNNGALQYDIESMRE